MLHTRFIRPRLLCIAVTACVLTSVGCSAGNESGADSKPTDKTSRPAAGKKPTGPEGSFSILTYNVAGLPAEISKENPAEHIPLISPLLDQYDVVLTQEDFDWWGDLAGKFDFVNYHERLRANATHPFKTAQHPGPEAVDLDMSQRPMPLIGDGQGIMSRFSFTDEQRHPWTSCFGGIDTSDGGAGDCLAMKGFAVVTLTLSPGLEIDVYTLHMEAGGTDADQQLQADNVAQLSRFIAQHSVGRAIVVGGDTNLHTESDHPDANGDADTQLWASLLADSDLTDACAATDCAETSRIDKIAYRSSQAVELQATSYDVPTASFRDPSGIDLSDHEPVVVNMKWNAITS